MPTRHGAQSLPEGAKQEPVPAKDLKQSKPCPGPKSTQTSLAIRLFFFVVKMEKGLGRSKSGRMRYTILQIIYAKLIQKKKAQKLQLHKMIILLRLEFALA